MKYMSRRTGEMFFSVSMRVIVWFTLNPTKSLTTPEIAAMFAYDRNNLGQALRSSVMSGALSVDPGCRGRNTKPSVYSAGPALLGMIERNARDERMAACRE